MDFSSQRKAKNLAVENLPSLPGDSQREPCSICSHVTGEQNTRKIGNPAILSGMSLGGQSILSMRGKGGRSCCQAEQATLPLFNGPSGMTPNRGSWQLCHQELSNGKQGQGGVSEWVPFTPELWQATSELQAASPDAKMNL